MIGDCHTSGERGTALLVVLMAVVLLAGLGGGLTLLTTTEAGVAAHFAAGLEAAYGADAAIERALADLRETADWAPVVAGTSQSAFVDGPPSGARSIAGGGTLDLTSATSIERCGRPGGCTDADLDAVTQDRPYGANNPRWLLFAYGPIRGLLPPDRIRSQVYVVVWVADDPLETDGAPLLDGGPADAGHAVVSLRARAYGLHGARRGVEVTVARKNGGVRVLSWREL